jgi:hypothetical protein
MESGKAIRSTLTEIASSVVPGTGWLTEILLDRVANEHAERASQDNAGYGGAGVVLGLGAGCSAVGSWSIPLW